MMFALGLLCGAMVGFFVAALLVAAKSPETPQPDHVQTWMNGWGAGFKSAQQMQERKAKHATRASLRVTLSEN